MDHRVDQIRESREALRQRVQQDSPVGCREGPPLSREAVAVVESILGLSLPDAYREFLMHVGDGGLGPRYGLLSIAYGGQQVLAGGEKVFDPTLGAKVNYREVFLDLGKPKDQDVVVWKRERVYELLWDCMSDDDRDKLSEFLDATVLQLTPAIPGDLWVDVLVLSGAKRGTVLTTFSFNPEDDHYVDFLGWYGQWLDSVKRKFTDA